MTAGDQVLDRLTLRALVPPPDECRRIRKAAKASRRDVAEALGVSEQTVIRWESGLGPGPRHLESYVNLLAELRRVAELPGKLGTPMTSTASELLRTDGALLSRSHLRELGLPRRAIDSVFRQLPTVFLDGYARPLIRAEDYRALLARSTFTGDRVR